MRHTWNIGLVIILAMCSASDSNGQNQKPYSKTSLKLSRSWISGDLMMKPGKHFSPDGQYYVVVGPPGEESELLFSRPNLHPHLFYTELLGEVDPGTVNGLAWLPGKPHTLVFATGHGDPGHSMLALWNGGQKVRMLHRVDNDQDDEFKLFAVSRDGKSIIYGLHGCQLNDVYGDLVIKQGDTSQKSDTF